MTTLQAGRRLPRLTSLRFAAAFLVFVFHATAFFEGDVRHVLDALVGQGRSGVTFFFVLSGFMLAWVWRPDDTLARFYRRRFARIYPAYLASILLAALLWAVADPGQLYRGILAPFLLQAWVPDSTYYFGLNVVAWSLSVEAFFYVAFPFAARMIAGRTVRTLWIVAAVCVAITTTLAVVASGSVAADGLAVNSFTVWLAFYCPVSRLPEFVLGMLLGFLLARGALPAVNWWLAIGVAAVGLTAAGVLNTSSYSVVSIVILPFSVLIVAAAQRDLSGIRGLLTTRWAVQLGTASYCFYLLHHIFILRLAQPGFRDLGVDGLLALVLAFGLSIGAAWLLHRCVEEPMELRLSGRISVTDKGSSQSLANASEAQNGTELRLHDGER